MATLKDTKRRIQAVRNTQKVTRAMKLVAAAKLKRAQQDVMDARSYSSEIYKTAIRVSCRLGANAPLMWRRPKSINCVDLIVITSNRGLCGGFNENLLRDVEEKVLNASSHNIETKLFVIGKKGSRYLSMRKYDIEIVPDETDELIDRVIDTTSKRYVFGGTAGAVVAFNKFVSAGNFRPTFWNLLPIHKRGASEIRNMEYIYEATRSDALNRLLKLTLNGSLKRALLESRAAELSARMTAMDNATRNADEMIGHLTSVYNKKRQEVITRELLDIVGGSEALK